MGRAENDSFTMNIATVGQRKYEYQDLVCVEMILRFLGDGVSCKVEPEKGEDATLWVNLAGTKTEIEVQVKGAEAAGAHIDLEVLADYLAHFPAHESSDFLAQRLLTPTKIVLLVCAQRAMDDCASFTVLPNWHGELQRQDGFITLVKTQSLIARIGAARVTGSDDGALKASRVSALARFAKDTDPKVFRTALRQLLIIERRSVDDVVGSIDRYLRAQGIPADLHATMRLRLRDTVVEYKQKGRGDVVPAILTVLAEGSVPSVTSPGYVERGDETSWLQMLTTSKVLLLSGPPRCGKSAAARWIGAGLQGNGYRVVVTSSVEHADRTLSDSGGGDCAVILDDPIGAVVEDTASAVKALRHLEAIIRGLTPRRRLIVAQSQAPLLAAARAEHLHQVRTARSVWFDLGSPARDFLRQVWLNWAAYYEVPASLEHVVTSGLLDGGFQFDAGSLHHLAANHEDLCGSAAPADVNRLACQSAHDFAVSLAVSGPAESVISAIAIGSSTVEQLAEQDLAFMLGSGGPLIKPKFLGMAISFGGDEGSEAPPAYAEPPRLGSEHREVVTKLERHGVVGTSPPAALSFMHPFYRSAAQRVVETMPKTMAPAVCDLIERGLFSVSPQASAAVARNLPWLHAGSVGKLREADWLVQLAEGGLSTYFPGTRDICYSFLLSVAQRSPGKYERTRQRWSDTVRFAGMDSLAWDGDVPFFASDVSAIQWFENAYATPSANEIIEPLQLMRQLETPLPPAKAAVAVIRYFRANKEDLELPVIGRLLSYGVGAIRAVAAQIWLTVPRAGDDRVLERLGRDEHPAVTVAITLALATGWPAFEKRRRQRLLELVDEKLSLPESSAIVLDEILRVFGTDEGTGTEPLDEHAWDFYLTVVPRALMGLPQHLRFSTARLSTTVDDALTLGLKARVVPVVAAWADWLRRKVDAGDLPDDYELGLCDAVIRSTEANSLERQALIEQVLKFPGTAAVMSFICDLVDGWDLLSSTEQQEVLTLVMSNRPDRRWLMAGALTRRQVPSDVQAACLGNPAALALGIDQVAELAGVDLFEACARVHCGEPQPLYYLGKHHASSSAWRLGISQLARRPDHPLFEMAFFDMAYRGPEEFRDLVNALLPDHAETVLHLLVRLKLCAVGDWRQEVTDLVLNAARDENQLARWHDHMVANVGSVLEGLSDILLWTTHEPTQRRLLEAVKWDVLAIRMLRELEKLGLDASFGSELGSLIKPLLAMPPLLYKTYDVLLTQLKQWGAAPESLAELDNRRKESIQRHHEKKGKPLVPTNPQHLSGWISP